LTGEALLARFTALDAFLTQHQALWKPRPFTHLQLPWETAYPNWPPGYVADRWKTQKTPTTNLPCWTRQSLFFIGGDVPALVQWVSCRPMRWNRHAIA
jgi:hypothetical protein